METLYFDVLQFAYHVGLALVVGGAMVLGSAVAPTVFKGARTRGEGGLLFGAILARFDQLAIFGVIVISVASVLKFFAFEDNGLGWRIIARGAALAILTVAVLYGSAWSNPVARTLRAQIPHFDELPANDPSRTEFTKLHRASSRAMRLAVLAGLVAMFLS